jgi:hypothetical protein
MNKSIEAFIGLAAVVLIFIGSSVVAGLWLGMAFWHAKAFYGFLP